MPRESEREISKDLEPRKIEVGAANYPNPTVEGRPIDVAHARLLAGGKSVLLVNIDVDPVPGPNNLAAGEVLKKINQEADYLITTPSVKEAMNIVSRSLEGSDTSSTIAIVARHPRQRKNIILVGSDEPQPKLVVVDAITHKIVNQKPSDKPTDTTTHKGINYKVWDLNPDRYYFVMGSGVTENFPTTKELQAVITRATSDKKYAGEKVTVEELSEYIALKAVQKMKAAGRPRGRRANKAFINDVTVAGFETPEREITKTKAPEPEPEKEQNAIFAWFKKLFSGEMIEEVKYSKAVYELSGKLSDLPKDEREKIITRLRASGTKDESIELLNALLSHNDTSDVSSAMNHKGITTREMRKLLDEGIIWDVVSVMLNHKNEFRTALSVILAEIPLGAIPKVVREKLGDIPEDVDMKVEPWFGDWYLCDMFWGRMQSALRKDGVIFVNGIPIKYLGKPAGVMLETKTEKGGRETLLEGQIVSPIDSRQRNEIKAAFDAGKTSITIEGLKLAVMRSWKEDTDGPEWKRAKKRLIKYRDNLPAQFGPKIGTKTRAQWRQDNKENL